MGFFGKQSVVATHSKQPKKTTSVLSRRTSGDTYAAGVNFSSYVYPITEMSGLGGNGAVTQNTTIVLYRLGQAVGPSAEDYITDSKSRVWLIQSVNTRLDEDIDDGWCVYDCTVYRQV